MNPNSQAWFVSSSGKGLSATIGGLSLIGVAQLCQTVLRVFGVDLDQALIGDILFSAANVIGGMITLFGLLRKAANAFRNYTA